MNHWLLVCLLPVLIGATSTVDQRFRLCGIPLTEKIKNACIPPGYTRPCTQRSKPNYFPVKRQVEMARRARRAAESYEKISTECCTRGRCSLSLITTFCCDHEDLVDFAHSENEPYLQQFLNFLRLSLFLF